MRTLNKKVNLLTVILSGLRHRWLVYFYPRYVISSLLKRKGDCQGCGSCCLLNKHWCRYFNDNKCELYENKPFFYEIFPIDEKDKQMSGVGKECGYYWNNER